MNYQDANVIEWRPDMRNNLNDKVYISLIQLLVVGTLYKCITFN